MRQIIAVVAFAFASTLLLNSCAQSGKKDYLVTIKTPQGDMFAILYDETPKHKENFIKLAKEKYFDSLLFHRVIEGFMIQGGDPNSKKALQGESLGMGGPGYEIDAEISPQFFHEKGALSAARSNNPQRKSSGSQFYIVQGTIVPQASIDDMKVDGLKLRQAFNSIFQNPDNKHLMDSLNTIYQSGDMAAYQSCITQLLPRFEKMSGIQITKEISPEMIQKYTTVGGSPHLDNEYTVFGKVIKGLDVIDKIAALPRDSNDRPVEDVRMTVTVEEMSRKKITKEYGYEYPIEKK